MPVANVVHWFCPSSEYCSVYCKKAGVFAVPMIGVGIVTTGVTWVSLKPATGAGKPLEGARNVSVCVASPSSALGIERLDYNREHPRRHRPECRRTGWAQRDGVAVDQQNLICQRLPIVRLGRHGERDRVSEAGRRFTRLSVTSGGSRLVVSSLSIRVKVFCRLLVLPATSVTCTVKVYVPTFGSKTQSCRMRPPWSMHRSQPASPSPASVWPVNPTTSICVRLWPKGRASESESRPNDAIAGMVLSTGAWRTG